MACYKKTPIGKTSLNCYAPDIGYGLESFQENRDFLAAGNNFCIFQSYIRLIQDLGVSDDFFRIKFIRRSTQERFFTQFLTE